MRCPTRRNLVSHCRAISEETASRSVSDAFGLEGKPWVDTIPHVQQHSFDNRGSHAWVAMSWSRIDDRTLGHELCTKRRIVAQAPSCGLTTEAELSDEQIDDLLVCRSGLNEFNDACKMLVEDSPRRDL